MIRPNQPRIHTGTHKGNINGKVVQFAQNGDTLTVTVGRKVVYSGTNNVNRAKILNDLVLPLCNMHKTTMSYTQWSDTQ